ncbi:FAD-binding protein [Salicibibacter halophilus]|uniref:FAD-binding protein n=1 Tax=Salicibibacter halophilus TaxID=2502791 RepID=A0A514LFY6_9BACI|nr:FAD-dependent oxidoreductase [Salicibibacter halophilus]QDI90766.1 FAD-binding protein [Salicibibacter halophilus]
MASKKYQTIVVGGGLAGMSAANTLHNKGIDYKVIEASNRSGGKVLSDRQNADVFFELGPQFVNKDMTEMARLIKASGMEIKETDMPENAISISSMNQEIDNLTDFDTRLDDWDGQVDERLSALYDRFFDDEGVKKIISSNQAELLNIHPDHISARALKEVNARYESEMSDLTHQSSGPLNQVISYLEKNIAGNIFYNEPVQQVVETNEGCTIITGAGEYEAASVIVAVPPTVASRISYSPNLKDQYQEALNSYTDGAIIKASWVYRQPFWHNHLVNGEVKRIQEIIYTDPKGVVVMDSSKKGEEHRLTMFIGADEAKKLDQEGEEHQRRMANQLLTEVFGDQAKNYEAMALSAWVNHPYCGGGYGASVHIGGKVDAAETLREPFHQFAFACSEIAEAFPNFMEGAVRSGQHAANRIAKEKR